MQLNVRDFVTLAVPGEGIEGHCLEVAVPAVHLNGTSKKELLFQLKDACGAVCVAVEKLALAAPHGRDYYNQPYGQYDLARAQHKERLTALNAIMSHLEAIAVAILDQDKEKSNAEENNICK